MSNPKGLKSTILQGPMLDIPFFNQAQWDPKEGSFSTLPVYMQGRLKEYNRTKNYTSLEFNSLSNYLDGIFTVQ